MSLASGTRLGPYEIQSAIGAGGMGEVYKARDTRLDRTVAIKVLPPDVSGRPGTPRALRARGARRSPALNHPHICALHDVGDHDGVDVPGDGAPRGRDAGGAPATGARCRSTRRSTLAHRDRRCACGRAPAGHRPSRPEARQRHADEGGRQAARLRPGEARRPPPAVAAGATAADDRAADRTGPGVRHRALHVAGAVGRQRSRTRAATCSPSAACCSRRRRDGGRSRRRATPASSRRS